MRAATEHEAEVFGAKMAVLARLGLFPEIEREVEELRDLLSTIKNPFSGYSRVTELPLTMLALTDHDLSTLNTHEIVTLGDLRQASDQDLLSIRGISMRKLRLIREEAECLTSRYVDWVIKTGRG